MARPGRGRHRLLIVKAGGTLAELAARRGDFEDWIAAGMGLAPGAACTCAVYRGEPLPDPDSVAAVVITGSHAMVTDRAPWSEDAAAWLRAAVDHGPPVLGICYGHQLLAYALGGEVGDHPGGREIGTVEVRLAAAAVRDPLLGVLPRRFAAQVSHAQSVRTLPPGALALADSDHEPHHAFRVGARAWGVQFHPEFDAEVMRAYVASQADAIAAQGRDPGAVAAAVRETPAARRLLARFAALVRDGLPAAASVPDPDAPR